MTSIHLMSAFALKLSEVEVEMLWMEQIVQMQPCSAELMSLLPVRNLCLYFLSGKEEAFDWIAADWNEGWQDRGPRTLPTFVILICLTYTCMWVPSTRVAAALHAFILDYFRLVDHLAVGFDASPSRLRWRALPARWLWTCRWWSEWVLRICALWNASEIAFALGLIGPLPHLSFKFFLNFFDLRQHICCWSEVNYLPRWFIFFFFKSWIWPWSLSWEEWCSFWVFTIHMILFKLWTSRDSSFLILSLDEPFDWIRYFRMISKLIFFVCIFEHHRLCLFLMWMMYNSLRSIMFRGRLERPGRRMSWFRYHQFLLRLCLSLTLFLHVSWLYLLNYYCWF